MPLLRPLSHPRGEPLVLTPMMAAGPSNMSVKSTVSLSSNPKLRLIRNHARYMRIMENNVIDTHIMAASGLNTSHTAEITDSTVAVSPTPKARNTGFRSWYMLSVAEIMEPSGPRRAMLEPSTDRAVDWATTNMLAQKAVTMVV